MAKNGTITQTSWTALAVGDKVTAANITELQTAIAALEGYAKNVDNCGFTNFCQKCQACQGCQRCQSHSQCTNTNCSQCSIYQCTGGDCNCSNRCSDDGGP